ncbi:hypothetical protein PybrP1_004346 [[Pythium] brassicae (nom. inval.)]|nr:hypothetical protein PybrP1_004346 [[Pythium] brassicae (nom. inval.)]
MCATVRLTARFRALESAWWCARSASEIRDFEARSGLDATSMRFFGEVFFLLGGLKSAVLFSNLPAEWRRSFAAEVVAASGVLERDVPAPLALCAIGDRVETAAEFDLSGDLVLISQCLAAECEAASERLRLRPARGSAEAERVAPPPVASQSAPHIVSERELARLLDYPVALSECRESMVEVGYFLPDGHSATRRDEHGDERAGSPLLLTSFCASEAHRARVAAHFARYRALWASSGDALGGGRLQLVETRL